VVEEKRRWKKLEDHVVKRRGDKRSLNAHVTGKEERGKFQHPRRKERR
jgi:hypothetical protein